MLNKYRRFDTYFKKTLRDTKVKRHNFVWPTHRQLTTILGQLRSVGQSLSFDGSWIPTKTPSSLGKV
jgi:hypothetical protein